MLRVRSRAFVTMLRTAARNPVWAVILLLAALPACRGNNSGRDRRDEPKGSGQATSAGSVYLARLAKRLEVYPEAKVDGVYRVRNGCAMLNDDLLVLAAGAAIRAGSGWAVLVGDDEMKRLVPGHRIMGGGGYYPVAQLAAEMNLATAEPVPARCAAVARQAVLVAPVERIAPPSAYGAGSR